MICLLDRNENENENKNFGTRKKDMFISSNERWIEN